MSTVVAETRSRIGSWPVVAWAFGILLFAITLGGMEALRYTNRLDADIGKIENDQQELGRVMNDLRTQTYLMAIGLRDYLLGLPSDSSVARQRLDDVQQAMNANISRLKETLGPQADEPMKHLSIAADRYWQSMVPVFSWTPSQRQQRGALFLQNRFRPDRAAVLSTVSEIEAVRSIALQGEREGLARAKQSFHNSLLAALITLISFGLTVALAATIRLRSLERREHTLRLQNDQDRQNLRELSHQLVKAQEEERRSLSRELHDQIGQMLTAIQMQFAKVEVSLESPVERDRHLKDGKTLVDRTVRAVRDMAMGLRPSILDDLGLTPALEWQAREFTQRSGVQVNLKLEGNLNELPDAHRTCLYRVVQEALTNCGRHAEAKQVSVFLRGTYGYVSLVVKDDGRGFDPEPTKAKGLGLIGIGERVRELGGTVNILSQPGKGTLLEVEMPSGYQVRS